MRKHLMKLMAAMLAAVLTCALPSALASGGFKAVVTSKSMKVYDRSEPHDLLGSLPKGTEVTVKDYSGDVALISYNGKTGLARVSDMKAVTEKANRASEADEDDESDSAATSDLSSARTMVTNQSAKVYRKASKSSDSVKISSGVTVRLLAYGNGWGKIERGGNVGYIRLSCLSDPEDAADSADEEEVVYHNRKAVVTTASCKVYASPSTSSAHVTVDKGTQLKLLAVKGEWAQVESGGNIGYMKASKLADKADSEAVEEVAASNEITTAEIRPENDEGGIFSGTNEQIIFKFLTREAGYSIAASCGVLANIKYESGYKTSSVGDSGTSYGICQWHLGRKTRLINWCKKNSYDYTSLKGQLYYLKYELKTYYPSVHNYIKGVSNSAKGAYDAGYYFCYHFEAPASPATRSVTRGNYAMNTLWSRYAT